MIFVYISETLLYLCFSLLMGSFILALIHPSKKPTVKFSKLSLQFSIFGIVIFSMFPIIRLILYLYEDIGLMLTIQNVLADFEIGQAWTFTLFVSLLFYLYVFIFPVLSNKKHIIVSILFTFSLIISLGWSSHSASLNEWSGFVIHSLHFLSVTIWVGILLVISWFSMNHDNWLQFLRWFTPVALSSLGVIIASGIFLMNLVVEISSYPNAWILPYGQALLVKHLMIVPVLIFAFINGYFIKRKIKNGVTMNPLPWVKIESIFLLFVFSATAVFGQQEPPHNIDSVVTSNGMSKMFTAIYTGSISSPINASFDFTVLGILFFTISLGYLLLIGFTLMKKAKTLAVFMLCFLLIVSLYLGLMNSVSY